jgi:hypothetical protein
MQSKASDVPSYIAEAPAERQAAMKKLRTLYRRTFAGGRGVHGLRNAVL